MNFITDVILPLALAFIMFTLGLGLSVKDFFQCL
jgi:predicted Na+-dependent transporter